MRLLLHSCSSPYILGSNMQSCSLTTREILPILDAILISPIGPYTSQFMVFSTSSTSLLPQFASQDGKSSATVRVGRSACAILSASIPTPSTELNDFGAGGGFVQALKIKSCKFGNTAKTQGTLVQQYLTDIALSAAGVVLNTSSGAVARLLQVCIKQLICLP
jgi:hypothetical protein